MKFDVGAEGASLWSDLKLITSGALMLGTDRSANPAAPVDQSKVDLSSGAMSLFFKNATTDLSKDSNSSFWNRTVSAVESFGSKLVEGAKDLIAGTTVASVDFSALGLGNREVHNAPGGKVETFANANIKAFDTGHDKIVQSRDADGKPHEVSVKTDDGRELSQTRDGVRKASSNESDLTILQDPKTGKVQAVDRSGAKVQEFDSKGTAIRFLESADKLVVQPGQTLEQAYLAYSKEPGNAERQKSHPVILMDGKGESMTVQPDGSKIYTHANGESTSVYKHLGADGKPHDIKVNISKGPDGNEILTIESEHGKKLQISSEEAKAMMQNSRLKLDEKGQLMVNNDFSGDAHRARWHRMLEEHRLNLGENANLDLRTQTVTVDDGKTHTVTTVDKTTGTVVESDFNRRPDGKFDDKPSRVTTIDNAGHATIQGMDPITGEKRAADLVTIDSNKHSVNAFNIEMNDKDAVVKHPDGSNTTVNRQGDIDAKDGQGRDIVRTSGDRVSYDGGNSYERYSSSGKAYTEEQAQ
ncbi:MAG: hypothetical protein K2X81_12210, partial [Candidatus Obscuribacterales bacterium]|nr:hypothetical protein [Candidatus Obscuribacterales bacterium]